MATKRRKTCVVKMGKVAVGGSNPIRIQSMTTSNTRDVEATVDQIKKLSDWGCEIARVTVQGKMEAKACEGIKNTLVKDGYDIPLVADIHFYPPAAMLVAEFVDKVRINPGNYVDKRAIFKTIEYTDEEYAAEITRIEEGFSPLVLKCKERGIAMRIGTNHGSLSDRIMNRYGDTPAGMVESAIEFAKVCRMHDYHNFLFSMKASNPLVMQEAYRLLVDEMDELGWDYPLHLGVTEAGNGEDGRVKSAVGTGSLLLDGIGDTIRVSLTEDPWYEIDPCKRLVSLFESYEKMPETEHVPPEKEIEKRDVIYENTPLHSDGSVFLGVSKEDMLARDFFQKIGCKVELGRPVKKVDTVDVLLVATIDDEMKPIVEKLEKAGMKTIAFDDFGSAIYIRNGDEKEWEQTLNKSTGNFILLELDGHKVQRGRKFFKWLRETGSKLPVILMFGYDLSDEDMVIHASTEFGVLLSESSGEGICIAPTNGLELRKSLSFSILQAARMRSSKTEFIACPGCGRTLFDLQTVTNVIREKTSHLPGVKIAIMGCIVNGPGEMADADFGYVGSRPGKVDLYVGKTCVEKNIEFDEAPDRLIALIKQHGRWKEPEEEETLAEV